VRKGSGLCGVKEGNVLLGLLRGLWSDDVAENWPRPTPPHLDLCWRSQLHVNLFNRAGPFD